MIRQVIADGNRIAFDETEFVVNKMRFRDGRRILERFRVYIPTLKELVMPFFNQGGADNMTELEMIEFFLNAVGVLDEDLVEYAQEIMFRYLDFRTSPAGEFLSLVPVVEDVAFENVSQTQVYLLLARCIYVNYQKDIEYWAGVFRDNIAKQKAEAENAALAAVEAEQAEGAE